MKLVLIFTLITLASCSTTPVIDRGPAAVSDDNVCTSGVKNFFDNGVNSSSKEDLLSKKVILQKDLKFLDGSVIAKSLSDNPNDREQMEISYLLIKKQYPDFSEEQVVSHYELLKVYCGM
ncbi:MAG: hypothetical protein H7177_15095 [Rhizobacter sp.]|nr:hypothetical protein [Bacteriovorax sp.]